MAVAVIMMMVVAMVMIVIMVMIMTVAGVEEFRLDLEDAIEIERAALQHVRQRHLAALGAVQQTQPLFISNTSSSAPMMRSLSMPISPNSLTITAYFLPCGSDRMRLSSVVLPAPR